MLIQKFEASFGQKRKNLGFPSDRSRELLQDGYPPSWPASGRGYRGLGRLWGRRNPVGRCGGSQAAHEFRDQTCCELLISHRQQTRSQSLPEKSPMKARPQQQSANNQRYCLATAASEMLFFRNVGSDEIKCLLRPAPILAQRLALPRQ